MGKDYRGTTLEGYSTFRHQKSGLDDDLKPSI
jgi:hypothetical protein